MIRFLKKLSSNFMFEWNPGVKDIFYRLSPDIWALANHNPHRFLKLRKESPTVSRHRFFEFMSHPDNAKLFNEVQAKYEAYMHPKTTLISERYPELINKTVAYFSMEFGINFLRTYSGGLGILSGDHIRGASDMGLKIVGVGLFYFHGYYQQHIDSHGQMLVRYRTAAPAGRPLRDYLPLEPVRKKDSHKNLIISVHIEKRDVFARVWKAQVGRNEIILLDTNIPENALHDRNITHRLYQAEPDHEMERKRRLEQEILLGVGGVRALKEAGHEPSAYHLNEGHVAFAAIEVIHQLMREKHLSFVRAKEEAAKIIGFTTHTPVPEGNERFHEKMVRYYFQPYLDSFLSHDSREVIFSCARNQKDEFDMTKLSLLLSGAFRNGVSRLHGEVCRKMWGYAWGISDAGEHEVPIGSITNSVHVPYWQAPEVQSLVEKAGGIESAEQIPDEEIWKVHQNRKEKMIQMIIERCSDRFYRERVPWNETQTIAEKFKKQTENLLPADSFIIGYARRFAGYKRAGFFLEDEPLFFSFLEESYRKYGKPIAIIYAGKPHPSGQDGIQTIRYIHEVAGRLRAYADKKNFEARLLFVEGYNIDLARRLVSGCDIWLNNPIRPQEASGTSGMKAGMNGVLNLSIPDGWCPEGIVNGRNGWMFGSGDAQDGSKDRAELYRLLNNEILPAFFDRPNGLSYSPRWAQMMKASIKDITKQFAMERMLSEYVEKMYLPAVRSGSQTEHSEHAVAH